jgi:hypothetical protein
MFEVVMTINYLNQINKFVIKKKYITNITHNQTDRYDKNRQNDSSLHGIQTHMSINKHIKKLD